MYAMTSTSMSALPMSNILFLSTGNLPQPESQPPSETNACNFLRQQNLQPPLPVDHRRCCPRRGDRISMPVHELPRPILGTKQTRHTQRERESFGAPTDLRSAALRTQGLVSRSMSRPASSSSSIRLTALSPGPRVGRVWGWRFPNRSWRCMAVASGCNPRRAKVRPSRSSYRRAQCAISRLPEQPIRPKAGVTCALRSNHQHFPSVQIFLVRMAMR
jgi:hypothetical protein